MTDKKTHVPSYKESRSAALHYFTTLTAISREAFVILDPELRVIEANKIFYDTFKVTEKATENNMLYDLGNGQWNIPELRILLEEILPQKKEVKDFSVTHAFETIGEKSMALNARQLDTVQLIVLAIEDTTPKKALQEQLADYNRDLERDVEEKTRELSVRVKQLEVLNESMVGRELKMIELKEEIDRLNTKLAHDNHTNGKT